MSPPVNKPRILVVEDEAIVARDIRLQLEELGYEPVGHATRGEEAIVLAGELKPDLVLMDIRLVGAMDGIAAAQAIRMQFGLAVVFLTAFAEDETLARAKLAEPLGYILKPFSERELRTVLSIALYKSKTEAKLHRVSQLYAALTACNQAIVRSTSEADLLPQICRDAVTFGGMKMAWVGLVQEASGWVKPVASFGDGDGYLADIRITVDAADPLGVGPTGTAVREGQPFWCQDFLAEPRTAAWHERGVRAGWAASAALPLRRGGVVVGSLTVYAAEVNAFDEDIRKLLLEMADDISFALESYRMRQALATAAELLERTSEMAKVGGWEVELQTGHLFWSREACRIHEVDPSEAPGIEDADRYCAPEARPLIYAAVSAAAEKGTPWDLELPALTAKGRPIWVRSQGSVVSEHGKAVKLVGAFQDITERKHAEEEKLRLEAQLQHAMKLESVGRLAGGVAHDFNNMLGVILANAEFAMDPVLSNYADLVEIKKAAERSADLTRQLLAFARKQTVTPKVLDVNERVAASLRMVRRLIGENIQVVWQPGAKVWPVHVDPSQLDQILTNLCVNARDAITDVGKIVIETDNRVIDAEFCVDHPDATPGDYVRVSVRDDGCGIDAVALPQIFEPFFTTKGTGAGTGLGLATVYGSVRQNHGFVAVSSEAGKGSTFEVYLPSYVGKADVARAADVGEPALRGHETILLVEDEPALLRITSRLLEAQGYTVRKASGPAEALRVAEERGDEIHLLVTDVIMPEMNGRDLAKAMLARHPRLRCHFMSGYTAEVIAHDGVLDEGVYFIQKPFSRPDLATKVREALDRPVR